ncbi:hypothetical protein PM082_003166 [Marasmius tenuissimus]|nr:hypothetical protein PM082_003166 [Marasmius tenuissimus]
MDTSDSEPLGSLWSTFDTTSSMDSLAFPVYFSVASAVALLAHAVWTRVSSRDEDDEVELGPQSTTSETGRRTAIRILYLIHTLGLAAMFLPGPLTPQGRVRRSVW